MGVNPPPIVQARFLMLRLNVKASCVILIRIASPVLWACRSGGCIGGDRSHSQSCAGGSSGTAQRPRGTSQSWLQPVTGISSEQCRTPADSKHVVLGRSTGSKIKKAKKRNKPRADWKYCHQPVNSRRQKKKKKERERLVVSVR